MGLLIAGVLTLSAILGVIWLKDRLESVTLQRVVYHELTARIAVAAVVMIMAGLLLSGSEMLKALGLISGGN